MGDFTNAAASLRRVTEDANATAFARCEAAEQLCDTLFRHDKYSDAEQQCYYAFKLV